MNETIESIRVLGIWKHLFLSFAYRPLSKAMHSVNLHYTKTIHMDDGSTIYRCDWCGVSRLERSDEVVQAEMGAACAKAA